MASRLPVPGQDNGTWGDILNDYLSQSLSPTGTINANTVGTTQLQTGAVTTAKLSATAPTSGQVLSYNGSALVWATPSGSGSVTNATTTTPGLVQLAGDLSGTATAPTVPALAGKADTTTVNTALAGKEPTITAGTTTQYYRGDKSFQTLDKTAVGLANVDNTSDVNKPVSTATQTALNAKANTSSLATVATSGSYTDLSNKPTIPTVSDATTSAKGIVQLAGDLAGTAAAPTVAKVNGITVTGTPSANQVLTASSGTAAAWATPNASFADPTTTKGDLIIHGTTTTRIGVGTDGQVLTADSAQTTGAKWATPTTTDATKLAIASNLSDLASAATARTNLGLGTAATISSTAGGDLSGTLPSPTVAKVNGVAISGTPSANQVLTASSSTAAAWAALPASGGSLSDVATTATTNGALVIGVHNPIDATSGNIAVTLANGASAGQVTAVEKTDATTNTVTITLNLRGTASSTLTLVWAHETVEFISKADGSWWPVAGHKTKASLDAAYVGASTQSILLPPSNGSDDTAAVNAVIAASPVSSIIVGRPGQTYIAGSGPFLFLGTRSYSMYGVTMRPKNAGNFDAVVASPAALTTGAGNNYDGPIQIYGLMVNGNVSNQTAGQGFGILIAAGANYQTGVTILRDVVVRDTRGTAICNTEVNNDGNGLVAAGPVGYTGEQRFENCRTYNSGGSGIWQRGGGLGGAAAQTDGFCINCTVAYTTHDGIRIDSSGGWMVDGNHPYGTGLSGVLVTGAFSTRVQNNYIEGIGTLDSATDHYAVSSAFSPAPAWTIGATFAYNQVTTYNGVIFKSKVDGNVGNQPDTSPTQWGTYAASGSVGAIVALSCNSPRGLHVTDNQLSLGHNSWSLNAGMAYRGILVQGPGSGVSKATAWIARNDIANELQGAGTNTTAIRLAAQGAGPSGVNSIERDNSIRGSWFATRSADATCSPIGSVGTAVSGGTGASVTLTGNNQCGNFAVTTGNSGVTAGQLVAITYTNTPAPAPRVVVMPRNAATAALGPFFVTTGTTGFSISGAVVPANNTTYNFDYIVMIGA